MEVAIVILFVVGYLLIALEHPIKINKTATALLTGVLCWTIFILSEPGYSLLQSKHYVDFVNDLKTHTDNFASLTARHIHTQFVVESLGHNLSEIAQILFFLLGAMTIVELIDSHQGFKFVTDRISTKSPIKLLWIICGVTFFLSAVLDNLTTAIVMVSLIRKLISNREMRLFFVGMIIVAANAGGAWSPIGDVTTTMLWIGGQISSTHIIKTLFIPSAICLIVPLTYLSFKLKGTLGDVHHKHHKSDEFKVIDHSSKLMLIVGLGTIILVPVFKTLTHLPPYLGMMLGLGIVWVVSELINPDVDESVKKQYSAAHALTKIDMPSILFFLGILLAVGALQSMNILNTLAEYLNHSIGDNRIIIFLIGILSSVVDNVPLVAASMGMYSLDVYHTDNMIWEYLAYCTGTGGSILVIGSAAGVAAMGMEKIDFIWYIKRISLIALLGYVSGAGVYLLLNSFLG